MGRNGDQATSKSQAPSKPNPFEDSIEGDRDGLKRNPPRKARRLVLREDTPSPPRKAPTPPPPKKHKSSTGESSSRASKGKGPAQVNAIPVPTPLPAPLIESQPPPVAQANEELALALPPIPYPFSEPLHFEKEEHQARFERIGGGKKRIIATSYPNWTLLGDFGIRDEVRQKLDNCGLHFYFEDDPGSFEMVMVEFLCTFEAEWEKDHVTLWRFMLGGREFEVKRRDLQDWLHLLHPRDDLRRYNDHNRAKFWQKISGRKEWFVSSYNGTGIKIPSWKVIHHLTALGINTRGGKARALTNPDMDLMMAIDQRLKLDWISILTERFEECVKEGSRNSAIGGGSLITLIALNCGFGFDHPECPKPLKRILDIGAMRRSLFLIPGTMLWDHDDKPHGEEVQKRARRNKTAFISKHRNYPLTPSPPSSPGPSVPPPSESIPLSSADWTSQFERLSTDMADLRMGFGRLEEFTHREFQFHRQEAQWVRSTLTSLVQNMSAPSSSASAPPPPPFDYTHPPYAPTRSHARPPQPIGFAPSYAPTPYYAPPPPYPTTGPPADEDRFASLDDDDDDDGPF